MENKTQHSENSVTYSIEDFGKMIKNGLTLDVPNEMIFKQKQPRQDKNYEAQELARKIYALMQKKV